MRRITLACLLLAGCSIGVADPKVIAATPAGIELSCVSDLGTCRSPQAVADAAEAHCVKYGLHARARMTDIAPSGNEVAAYDCVPLPGSAAMR